MYFEAIVTNGDFDLVTTIIRDRKIIAEDVMYSGYTLPQQLRAISIEFTRCKIDLHSGIIRRMNH